MAEAVAVVDQAGVAQPDEQEDRHQVAGGGVAQHEHGSPQLLIVGPLAALPAGDGGARQVHPFVVVPNGRGPGSSRVARARSALGRSEVA
jgi:hypothetical protein